MTAPRTNIPAPFVVGDRNADRLTGSPSLITATCEMHRHHGAADALLTMVDSWPAQWPAHIRDHLMHRALSHQRACLAARADYLAAGGEPTAAEKEAQAYAAEHNALLLDGARDALEEAHAFGTADEVDRAQAQLDAVRLSVVR